MLTISSSLLSKTIKLPVLILLGVGMFSHVILASEVVEVKLINVRQESGKLLVDLSLSNKLENSIFFDKNIICPIELEFSSSFGVITFNSNGKKVRAEKIGLVIEYSDADIVEVNSKSKYGCTVRLDDKNYLVDAKRVELEFNAHYFSKPSDVYDFNMGKNINDYSEIFKLTDAVANRSKISKVLDGIPGVTLPAYERSKKKQKLKSRGQIP